MPFSIIDMFVVSRLVTDSRSFTLLPTLPHGPRDARSPVFSSRHRQDDFRHRRCQQRLIPEAVVSRMTGLVLFPRASVQLKTSKTVDCASSPHIVGHGASLLSERGDWLNTITLRRTLSNRCHQLLRIELSHPTGLKSSIT
jgi:hypothetical protein